VRRTSVFLALLVLPLPVRADEARDLLQRSEAMHRTATQEYSGELSVVSKEGRVRKKSWKSWRQGYAGDAKQLIRFTAPPEVKGVGFLSVSHPAADADQWLYLPSMKRERRIATQDRDASFVGTDFNYEDMEEFDQGRYDVETKGEETVDGQACVLIEARPKGKSIYEKKLLAMRKDILYLVRVESWKKGEKEIGKRLVLSDVARVDGHWAARKLEMKDLKKGSTTTVLLQQLAFDRPQPADRFTIQNLTREGGD
jgi:outer membrane lipoprotein-sorting protein